MIYYSVDSLRKPPKKWTNIKKRLWFIFPTFCWDKPPQEMNICWDKPPHWEKPPKIWTSVEINPPKKWTNIQYRLWFIFPTFCWDKPPQEMNNCIFVHFLGGFISTDVHFLGGFSQWGVYLIGGVTLFQKNVGHLRI